MFPKSDPPRVNLGQDALACTAEACAEDRTGSGAGSGMTRHGTRSHQEASTSALRHLIAQRSKPESAGAAPTGAAPGLEPGVPALSDRLAWRTFPLVAASVVGWHLARIWHEM